MVSSAHAWGTEAYSNLGPSLTRDFLKGGYGELVGHYIQTVPEALSTKLVK